MQKLVQLMTKEYSELLLFVKQMIQWTRLTAISIAHG